MTPERLQQEIEKRSDHGGDLAIVRTLRWAAETLRSFESIGELDSLEVVVPIAHTLRTQRHKPLHLVVADGRYIMQSDRSGAFDAVEGNRIAGLPQAAEILVTLDVGLRLRRESVQEPAR